MNPRQRRRVEGLVPREGAPADGAWEAEGEACSLRAVAASTGGIVAAWIAGGAAGFLASPLQHALAWLGIAVVLVAGWPRRAIDAVDWVVLAGATVVGIGLTVPAMAVYNVVAVAMVLAAVAWTARGVDRRALVVAACAVATLAVYRWAFASIPAVWLAFSAVGEGLGHVAGAMCGRPLNVGATFGGLDFLVLMAALYAGWLIETVPPRRVGATVAAAAILGGHLIYLMVLACSHDLLAAIPKTPLVEAPLYQSDLYVPPPWYWGDAVRTLIPWNLPLLALLLHATIAATMFRRARWTPPPEQEPAVPGLPPSSPWRPRQADAAMDSLAALGLGAAALAAFAALVTSLSTGSLDLTGRRIVVYEHGPLDWEKPKFDRFGEDSAGQFGMLPMLVEGFGGRFSRTTDLSPASLEGVDVLLVIDPTKPWSSEQTERVWDYVRGGGTLLVLAEPRGLAATQSNSLDDLLATTAMQVRFDTALPCCPHWQDGLEAVAHPAGIGIDGRSNGFALAQGSSIRLGWPARPLLVGRSGWSDPGSDAALTGTSRFDLGERLGDLVLAAEQNIGQGTVVVLADATPMKNLGLADGYEFAGRLLGYLAARASSPQAAWRQILGLFACLGLVGLLGWRAEPGRLLVTLSVFAFLLIASTAVSEARSRVLFDGRGSTPNPVACIDASHLEAAAGEPWSEDGLAGLQLHLMRNGYLPIVMRRWSEEQLDRVGMLIAVGPARRYSEAETLAVRGFVEGGGVLLCMAGANDAGPVQSLLDEFGLSVPLSPLAPENPQREPEPMGYFRTPFVDTGKYQVYVGFYAGWPVEGTEKNSEPLVRGFEDRPVVVSARVGQGKVFLFGDTYFATNKNLESEDGGTARVVRENSQFWRWFFADLNGRKWTPPEPTPEPEESEQSEEEEMSDESMPDAAGQSAPAQDASSGHSPGKEATP